MNAPALPSRRGIKNHASDAQRALMPRQAFTGEPDIDWLKEIRTAVSDTTWWAKPGSWNCRGKTGRKFRVTRSKRPLAREPIQDHRSYPTSQSSSVAVNHRLMWSCPHSPYFIYHLPFFIYQTGFLLNDKCSMINEQGRQSFEKTGLLYRQVDVVLSAFAPIHRTLNI